MARFLLVGAAIVVIPWWVPANAFSQDGDLFEPGTLPRMTFSEVCVARIDSTEDGVVVAIQVPKFRPAARTEKLNVTRFLPETRTRTVLKDGVPVEQTFTVMVPVVEQVERTVTVFEADGFTVTKVPVNLLVAKKLDGTKLSEEELTQRLEMPTHVFLVRAPSNDDEPPIDEYYRTVLRRDLILLYIDGAK